MIGDYSDEWLSNDDHQSMISDNLLIIALDTVGSILISGLAMVM